MKSCDTPPKYELYIYCDAPECKNRGEYTGENKHEVHRNARADGWTIGEKCYCNATHTRQHKVEL